MRQLDWDYTLLADAYVKRPHYADHAVDSIVQITGVQAGDAVLDLGAGDGHLTVKLAGHGLDIVAMEPNANMRAHGIRRTHKQSNVRWTDGVMEDTGLPDAGFRMCTYGSSFGVVDQQRTLQEAARLLEADGWFACVFNHRVLDDPLQRQIETHIKTCLPTYGYGPRRRDQAEHIAECGLFGSVHRIEAPFTHIGPVSDWVDAWRSHATLQRQAGHRFEEIVEGIEAIVKAECGDTVEIDYITRGWMAQRLPW